jgi:hypothetical protein
MDKTTVFLPIKCPQCGTESLTEFPTIVVATALTQWNQLQIHANCHPKPWDASAAELQAIRNHLGPTWIEANCSIRPPTATRH